MNIAGLFQIPKDLTYLNSGTMAFTPNAVLAAHQRYKNVLEQNPALGLLTAWPQMAKAQQALAGFLSARTQDLYLRANVTIAMNDFLLALKLPPSSEIIISDLEYGAIVNICRFKAEKEGHSLKIVPGGPDFVKSLEAATTAKTKLVMVSHVTTGSGFVFPIEEIAAYCRAKKIFFAVDGAHGAGALPIDLSNTQVDFYGSNLHKWMMGPKGTGFGWVHESMRKHLEPQFAGWTTYDVMPHFQAMGPGSEWATRWMICSTVHFPDYYAIADIVHFWNEIGIKKAFARQKNLRDFAAKKISEATGWVCISDNVEERFRGPMVAFSLPENLAVREFELIFHLKVVHQLMVSMTQIRGQWCLRMAPHIYNTEVEIERAAEILASL